MKDLYHLLEHEFLPLDAASKIQPLLTKISKLGGKLSSASSVPEVQLSQYIPALEKLATLRLLQQVQSCLFVLSYFIIFIALVICYTLFCHLCFSLFLKISPWLLQVSQVFQTMKMESLSQIIPFFDFSMVEKISVDAVKHNFIAMKFDHMKGIVVFGNMVR